MGAGEWSLKGKDGDLSVAFLRLLGIWDCLSEGGSVLSPPPLRSLPRTWAPRAPLSCMSEAGSFVHLLSDKGREARPTQPWTLREAGRGQPSFRHGEPCCGRKVLSPRNSKSSD